MSSHPPHQRRHRQEFTDKTVAMGQSNQSSINHRPNATSTHNSAQSRQHEGRNKQKGRTPQTRDTNNRSRNTPPKASQRIRRPETTTARHGLRDRQTDKQERDEAKEQEQETKEEVVDQRRGGEDETKDGGTWRTRRRDRCGDNCSTEATKRGARRA